MSGDERNSHQVSGVPNWVLVAIALFLAVVAYARVLPGEFEFDDEATVVNNAGIRDLSGSLRALVTAPLQQPGRPVTYFTFALNYAVGRLDPWGFHATNLACHLAVALLVFFFTRRLLAMAGMDAGSKAAAVVTGIFALHPLQSQAVSYVSQRGEVLASGFYLAAILLLLEVERLSSSCRRRVLAYVSSLLCFALGLGAKEIAITMPTAYLLLAATVPNAETRQGLVRWRTRFAFLVPFLFVQVLHIAGTLHGTYLSISTGAAAPTGAWLTGMRPWTYLLSQWPVLVTYLRLLFWPTGQCLDWIYPLAARLDGTVIGAGLFLGFLVCLAMRGLMRVSATIRVASFGLFWFFIVLATTSSLVPLPDILVEHRVYLASWGIFVAVVLTACRLIQHFRHSTRRAISVSLVIVVWSALAVTLFVRNAVWETRIAMGRDIATKDPQNPRAHALLGTAYLSAGNYDLAIPEFKLALDPTMAPGKLVNESSISMDLGAALVDTGRVAEGIVVLERAYERNPTSPPVLASLAAATLHGGQLARAEAFAQRALTLDPEQQGALLVLGYLRLAENNWTGAIDVLTHAIRVAPDDPVRLLMLATAYAKLGKKTEACSLWRAVDSLPGSLPVDRAQAERAAAELGCDGARR
jgi:Flp pilus assembly protein TadD